MKGWSIFKHSVLLVLRNWREALRIGLVAILSVIALGLAIVLPLVTSIEGGAQPGVGALLAMFIFMLFAFAMMLNVVISWHRFVLLEEYPESWLPTWQGGRILGYFGRLLLLTLLGMVLMIPVMIMIVLLGGIGGAVGGETGGAALVFLALIPIYIFAILAYYRLAVILPSGAIDKPLTIGDAWDKTRGSMGVLFVMLLLFIAMNIAIQVVVGGLVFVAPVVSGLLSVGFSVFTSMVGVSVLTTLYGHYVEGRPID